MAHQVDNLKNEVFGRWYLQTSLCFWPICSRLHLHRGTGVSVWTSTRWDKCAAAYRRSGRWFWRTWVRGREGLLQLNVKKHGTTGYLLWTAVIWGLLCALLKSWTLHIPVGFMDEAESLLTISATDSYDRMRNAPVARSLLQTLHSETSIFRSREPPPERYMFILVREDAPLTLWSL